MMKKIGLTGVMGSGKTALIEILEEYDIVVINCDQINADLLQRNAKGYLGIMNTFKEDILNKKMEIDPKKLSAIIFSDENKRKQLETIMHPLIKEEINRQLALYQEEDIVVVEVPLLFEVKWESFFDEIWVIACDEYIRLERLLKYRGVAKQEALLRMSKQMSQQEKMAKADIIFYNNGTQEELAQQVDMILMKE